MEIDAEMKAAFRNQGLIQAWADRLTAKLRRLEVSSNSTAAMLVPVELLKASAMEGNEIEERSSVCNRTLFASEEPRMVF